MDDLSFSSSSFLTAVMSAGCCCKADDEQSGGPASRRAQTKRRVQGEAQARNALPPSIQSQANDMACPARPPVEMLIFIPNGDLPPSVPFLPALSVKPSRRPGACTLQYLCTVPSLLALSPWHLSDSHSLTWSSYYNSSKLFDSF